MTAQTELQAKTINLILERSAFGNRKKATTAHQVDHAESGWTRLTKSLLKSDELKKIKDLDADVRQWMWSHCLPNPLYRQGVYLVPLAVVATVEDYLNMKQAQRNALVEDFLTAYPQQIELARLSLAEYFNVTDYPTTETMRSKFSMSWRYVAETSPTQLASISAEFFEQERQKAEAKFAEAVDEVRTYLRSSLKDIVDHMATRLTDTTPGKRNRFTNTLCDNLNSFVGTFTLRNVTDDYALDAVVTQLRQLTAGITPQELRDDDELRGNIASRLSEIKSSVDAMVVSGADRALILEDD